MSLNEDIVISGMSGRFPSSRNVEEFKQNLYGGVDMITEKDDRWPHGLYGITNRMGRVPDFDRFDNNYFGIAEQIVQELEPKTRLLLETVYEAIIDSGINPQSLQGTRTGVYIGDSGYPNSDGLPENILAHSDKVNPIPLTANFKANYANRVSFIFDFKGPSLVADTACSAGLTAFTLAINDFLLGRIDYAIVGAAQFTLQPYFVHGQQEMGLCSPRGISAVLDESADGYVKADAIASVFLQRSGDAKRVYATVLSARMNVDGRKTAGMFYPSSIAQEELMVMSYKDTGIDPLKLTLIEAHLTGTQAGDPEETKAIYNAYCSYPGRKDILPLGALKSNMGHAECCSSLAALVKVILCFENESIPPNLNLKELRHDCKNYCPPLLPVTETLKYEPGMAAINSFGIGGVNGHLLIEPNYKLSNEDNFKISENIPRIVNICGRTEEGVKYVFSYIENNPQLITRDFLSILGDTMKTVPSLNSEGFTHRGSIIIKNSSEEHTGLQYEYKKRMSQMKSKTLKPIWFLFPGLGGQWSGMAKALMPIKIFADKIEECHQILSKFEINLKHLLLSEEKDVISTMTAKFCATTAIEIALFEVLKALDITPDGIIGHSFGEVACAYADGCISTEEAMAVTYLRGAVTESDEKIIKGFMVVCALSFDQAKNMIPPEVVIGCNNAKNTVVLSGPEKQMDEIIGILKQKYIYCHKLDSSDIPYHSHYIMSSAKPMADKIREYITNPRKRSKKWISTSILEAEPKEEILKYASAEYFTHNLINPVYFYDKLKDIPSDAIIIEIGPHGVFRKIVNETLETATYLTLIKKDSNDTNLDNFLSAIATLYELGLNPSIENLYPKVEFPVSRSVPSISSLLKWDHSYQYSFPQYPDKYNKSTASDTLVTIDVLDNDQKFYLGHCIDGNKLFPATGYLMLVWRHLAAALGKKWRMVPVLFESIQLRRAVFLTEEKIILKVRYDRHSGWFNIVESDNICVVGKVSSPLEDSLMVQHLIEGKENILHENEYSLGQNDIYKDLQINGYDYSGEFRRLKTIQTNDFQDIRGVCEWNGNMVTFLDGLFQSMVFATPFRKLMVPTMIKSLRIDPKVLFDAIDKIENKYNASQISYDDQGESCLEINDKNDIDKIIPDIHAEIRATAVKSINEPSAYVPLYYNYNSKLLVAPGIEVDNMMATPIARKADGVNLALESYEFVPNDDNNAIEEYDRNIVTQYLEVYIYFE